MHKARGQKAEDWRIDQELACLDLTPLCLEVERLSDALHKVQRSALVNIVAKYFFAFVYPGAQKNSIPVKDIRHLFSLFYRCASLNEPDDDIETMNILRRFAPSLQLVADVGRAASILSEMLLQNPVPREKFLGLDLQTGSGLLALGQSIMAQRLGYEKIAVWGMEEDEQTALRADSLLGTLESGKVVAGDPCLSKSYAMLRKDFVSFVSCPQAFFLGGQLAEKGYFAGYRTLFQVLGEQARHCVFFPEGLIAYSREMNMSFVLSKEEGYQLPAEYADMPLYSQGLVTQGRVLPLHHLA